MRTHCIGVTLGLFIVLTIGTACGRTKHFENSFLDQRSIYGTERDLIMALRAELSERGIDPNRRTNMPVSGDANCVKDISLSQDEDERYIITWHYRNAGDYDQNGIVEIADVTQLAIHFGESVGEDKNTLAAVIDGDNSGTVDIGDITPIAMYYGANVKGYILETAESPEGTFDELDRVYLEDMLHDDGRLRSDYLLSNLNCPVVRVVPFDSEEERGIISEEFTVELESPVILSVRPLTCEVNRAVTYMADVTGEGQRDYFWQFGENAIPGTSDSALPTVVISEIGESDCNLAVTTPFGADTFNFTITVVAEGAEPYITSVEPQSGLTDTETTFAATVGGALPITYAWDFGDCATPPTSSDSQPTVVYNGAGEYPVTLIVENAFGDDLYQFDMRVVDGINLEILGMRIRLEGTENSLAGDAYLGTDRYAAPLGGNPCQGSARTGCAAHGYLEGLLYLYEDTIYGYDQAPPPGQADAYEGTFSYVASQLEWTITCLPYGAEELFEHDIFEAPGHLQGYFGTFEDVYTVIARLPEGTVGVPDEAVDIIIEMNVADSS